MADEQSRTVAVLERVFLRLTLADDSKLTDILKRILPMLLGLFKPGQQIAQKKNMEVLSHILKRIRANKFIELPCVALLGMLSNTSSDGKSKAPPNAFARNFAAVFLQAGLARTSKPAQLVEMFPLALRALREVQTQHQSLLLNLIIRALPEVKFRLQEEIQKRIAGLNPPESALMRSLRRKKDVEMLLQYMTEIMFYQSGSRLPACALVETCKLLHEWAVWCLQKQTMWNQQCVRCSTMEGLTMAAQRRISGKTPPSNDTLATWKLNVVQFVIQLADAFKPRHVPQDEAEKTATEEASPAIESAVAAALGGGSSAAASSADDTRAMPAISTVSKSNECWHPTESYVLPLLVVAAVSPGIDAQTKAVAGRGLRRYEETLDPDDEQLALVLMRLFLNGSCRLYMADGIDADARGALPSQEIRSRLIDILCRLRAVPKVRSEQKPLCVGVVSECLLGSTSTEQVHLQGIRMLEYVLVNSAIGDEAETIAASLFPTFKSFVASGVARGSSRLVRKLLSHGFVAFARRAPKLSASNVWMCAKLFTMIHSPEISFSSEVTLSMHDALSNTCQCYASHAPERVRQQLLPLIIRFAHNKKRLARLASAKWACDLYPFHQLQPRFVGLLLCTDPDMSVREAAKRGLQKQRSASTESNTKKSSAWPDFVQLIQFLTKSAAKTGSSPSLFASLLATKGPENARECLVFIAKCLDYSARKDAASKGDISKYLVKNEANCAASSLLFQCAEETLATCIKFPAKKGVSGAIVAASLTLRRLLTFVPALRNQYLSPTEQRVPTLASSESGTVVTTSKVAGLLKWLDHDLAVVRRNFASVLALVARAMNQRCLVSLLETLLTTHRAQKQHSRHSSITHGNILAMGNIVRETVQQFAHSDLSQLLPRIHQAGKAVCQYLIDYAKTKTATRTHTKDDLIIAACDALSCMVNTSAKRKQAENQSVGVQCFQILFLASKAGGAAAVDIDTVVEALNDLLRHKKTSVVEACVKSLCCLCGGPIGVGTENGPRLLKLKRKVVDDLFKLSGNDSDSIIKVAGRALVEVLKCVARDDYTHLPDATIVAEDPPSKDATAGSDMKVDDGDDDDEDLDAMYDDDDDLSAEPAKKKMRDSGEHNAATPRSAVFSPATIFSRVLQLPSVGRKATAKAMWLTEIIKGTAPNKPKQSAEATDGHKMALPNKAVLHSAEELLQWTSLTTAKGREGVVSTMVHVQAQLLMLLRHRNVVTQEYGARSLVLLYNNAEMAVKDEVTSHEARKDVANKIRRKLLAALMQIMNFASLSKKMKAEQAGNKDKKKGSTTKNEKDKEKFTNNTSAEATNNSSRNSNPISAVYRELYALAQDAGDPLLVYALLPAAVASSIVMLDDLADDGNVDDNTSAFFGSSLSGDTSTPRSSSSQNTNSTEETAAIMAGVGGAVENELLMQFRDQLIPLLFVRRYMPHVRVRSAMQCLWTVIVEDETPAVQKFSHDIISGILTGLKSAHWTRRYAACEALQEILTRFSLDYTEVIRVSPGEQSNSNKESAKILLDLWKFGIRVMDDAKEQNNRLAKNTMKALKRFTIRAATPTESVGSVVRTVVDHMLPYLMNDGIYTRDAASRQLCMDTLLELMKVASASSIHPHTARLVAVLLEAQSPLEHGDLSKLQQQTHTDTLPDTISSETIERIRVSVMRSSPLSSALALCLKHVDGEVMKELAPVLSRLIKRAVGLPTRVATAHFVGEIVGVVSKEELKPHAQQLLKALSMSLLDESVSVRKAVAKAAGAVCKVCKTGTLKKYILKVLELSKTNAEVAGEALHFLSRGCLSRMQRFKQEIIPVVYMRRLSLDDKIATQWGDIWNAVTDNVNAKVTNLYTKEIVSYAQDGLMAAEWQLKRQAALALEQLAGTTERSLLAPFAEPIVNAIVSCLKGSGVWDGKAALLLALSAIILRTFLHKDTKFPVDASKECTVNVDELAKTLGREARRVLGQAVREARDKASEKAARYSSKEAAKETASNESQTYCQNVLCCVRKIAQAALVFRNSDSALDDPMGFNKVEFFTPVQSVLQRVLALPTKAAKTDAADTLKFEEFEAALRAEALRCFAVTCTHSLAATDRTELSAKYLQENIVLCCDWVDISQTSWTVAVAGLEALQSLLRSPPALTDSTVTTERITTSLLACLRNSLYTKLRIAALEFLQHESLSSRLLNSENPESSVWAKLHKVVMHELNEFIEDSSPRVVELCCSLIEKYAT